MFSHNGPMAYGIGTIYGSAVLDQVIIKFPTYFPDGVTLFDFIVVHNGSKFYTGGDGDDEMRGAAIGWRRSLILRLRSE